MRLTAYLKKYLPAIFLAAWALLGVRSLIAQGQDAQRLYHIFAGKTEEEKLRAHVNGDYYPFYRNNEYYDFLARGNLILPKLAKVRLLSEESPYIYYKLQMANYVLAPREIGREGEYILVFYPDEVQAMQAIKELGISYHLLLDFAPGKKILRLGD